MAAAPTNRETALPARTLLIGLDSASVGLVRRWLASGDLPELERLRRRGCWGTLASPPGLGDDAVWASFATCANPGSHGRFYFRTIEPASYAYRRVRESDQQRETFWDALSRQGLRCAVIDVPKCALSSHINGLHLADWRVHGRDGPTRSRPAELAAQVLARHGDDRTDRYGTEDWLCGLEGLPADRLDSFVERLLASVADKTRLASELLARESWDLFLAVFKESHCAGHQCWHLTDPGHPDHSAALTGRLADPLLRVYRALDQAIGALAAAAGPGTSVLVFSDLDMAANYTGEHLLDEVLLALERALWPDRAGRAPAWRTAMHALHRRIAGPLGAKLRRIAAPPAARLAFQLEHNEISGAVRLNLKGREPAGTVAPGADAEAVAGALTRELLRLVNPATGGRIVQEVLRTDQVYRGERGGLLPDLLVVWSREAPILAAASPLLGTIRPPPPRFRPGNHLADGFCIAAGPGLPVGVEFAAAITDLGPTAARLLGASLDRVEGRPIPALRG